VVANRSNEAVLCTAAEGDDKAVDQEMLKRPVDSEIPHIPKVPMAVGIGTRGHDHFFAKGLVPSFQAVCKCALGVIVLG